MPPPARSSPNAAWAAGATQCWGSNQTGQLGDGRNLDSSVPVLVPGVTNAVKLFLGGGAGNAGAAGHTCAVLMDGSAWCLGASQLGLVGTPFETDRNVWQPQQLTAISDVVDISAGGNHTCATLRDDTVWCWGNGEWGRLGNGDTVDSVMPVRVVGIP